MHYAARFGHKEVVIFLLNYPYNDLNRVLGGAMYLSCRSGRIEIVEALINRGFDMESKIDPCQRYTALHVATYTGEHQIAQLLLDRGANVHAKDYENKTALFNVALSVETAKVLLNYGANPNEIFMGRTILHLISMKYTLCRDPQELLETLLPKADPHIKNYDQKTPLEVATERGNFFLVLPLIKWTVKKYFTNSDVCAENFATISQHSNLLTYWNDCRKEMQIIRDEMIHDTNVKLVDIMQEQSLTQLASYARNQTIVESFNPQVLESKFPIYYDLLEEAFEKGMLRRKLQDRARKVFCCLYDKNDEKLPELPITFTDQVFSYLNNNDLINFST